MSRLELLRNWLGGPFQVVDDLGGVVISIGEDGVFIAPGAYETLKRLEPVRCVVCEEVIPDEAVRVDGHLPGQYRHPAGSVTCRSPLRPAGV